MPLQSTRRAPRSAALDADLAWATAAPLQVFVSRAAVAAAIATAPSAIAGERTRIAVGRATAAMLQRHALTATTAPGHAEDSDGVLGLAQLSNIRGLRVAIWAAPGGRDRIAEVLSQRGAEVRVILVYRRVPQRAHAAALRRLRTAGNRIVLTATSGALLNALDLALRSNQLTQLRKQPLIVASERIAASARLLGFEQVDVAVGASAAALIAALKEIDARASAPTGATGSHTIECADQNDPLPSLKTKS
jgi:uroporphyrinogen-III synthase